MTISSPHFRPVDLKASYNRVIQDLQPEDCTQAVLDKKEWLLTGEQMLWGMPFCLGDSDGTANVLLLKQGSDPIHLPLTEPICTPWLVFLHAADFKPDQPRADGTFRPHQGIPHLGEIVCEYILHYSDGSMATIPVRRRFQINEFQTSWGENGFECVPHKQPVSIRSGTDDILSGKLPGTTWGRTQFRLTSPGEGSVMRHWIYPYDNPFPDKPITSLICQPRDGTVFLFGLTAGWVSGNPVRWEARQKMRVTMSQEDEIQIDLGQIISITPSLEYTNDRWGDSGSYHLKPPVPRPGEFLVEYTAHPDARLFVREHMITEGVEHVQEAIHPVTIHVVDRITRTPVAAKIHVHGTAGEYLPPMNRHRIPSPHWFEDYGTDYIHNLHCCTYIDGVADYRLPSGTVYIEVSKGFEVQPVRRTAEIDATTREIVVELEHVLPWRQKGWVTADTHVHFLSPQTALLEGAAEGVNVINLLASQWGEMFSNMGDFDGKTTIGSLDNGGSGEYLVRVGTENRQQVLGHISLLGYEGKMIVPVSSGGPNESALGDPVEATLSSWAAACRDKKGLVIMPHFPNPRAEGASTIVLGLVDGIEMCSFGDLYGGISPYALSDWYRFLNCGYLVPAVGGTDKMSATTAVGTIRTYAQIRDHPFTYNTWMDAVRRGHTFVTYGPLLEFQVQGREMGERIKLSSTGATLDVTWKVATVTVPVSAIEIVVNGNLHERWDVNLGETYHVGSCSLEVKESCWIALRIRGRYPDKKEMIAAHSSAVMTVVEGKECLDAADAMSILEQMEGATAYLRTLGTRAEEKTFQRLMATLTQAHRTLHNRMHRMGIDHHHTAVDHHHPKEK